MKILSTDFWQDGTNHRKVFFAAAVLWVIWWVFLTLISLENAFVDVLENIVWGSHFSFGYDKNPYVGAWIGYGAYRLFGESLTVNYLLSYLFVATAFVCVWKLARKITNNTGIALACVLLLSMVNFYGMKAAELCDDVMELGWWPLSVWFFYSALADEKGRWKNWLLTGLFCGISLMTKYYGVVLLASMFLVLVLTKEGRAAFRSWRIYAGGAVFLLLLLPNLLWLMGHDMVALDYAFGRANLNALPPLSDHFRYPLRSIERIIPVLLPPLAAFAVLFFRRDRSQPPYDPFNRTFLRIMAWGPFGFTLLFSLATGAKINYSWCLPCFFLFPLWLFAEYRPKVDAVALKRLTLLSLLLMVIFGTVFSVRSLWFQGYRKKNCDVENFPGSASASGITEEWRTRFRIPVRYVIGGRTESSNFAVYSPDRPQAYFSANPVFSPWIDEAQLKRDGAVVLWEGRLDEMPKYIRKFPERGFMMTPPKEARYPRAVPAWFRKLTGKTPKDTIISYAFIPPRGKE